MNFNFIPVTTSKLLSRIFIYFNKQQCGLLIAISQQTLVPESLVFQRFLLCCYHLVWDCLNLLFILHARCAL